jgi:predicted metal-dependent phosphoesterase TrpH
MLRGVIRVDLHVHSSGSFDCEVDPREIALRARQLGLGPIFITDHDTIAGAMQLQEIDASTVIGQEVTMAEGELIGLFLRERIEPGLDADEAVDAIHDQGGLVYLEHPYDSRRRRLEAEALERVANRVDIVEVFNGRSDDASNRRAEDLQEILGAAPGAGSDAHTLEELGSVYVEMEAFEDPQDFLAKLRRGRVVRNPSRLLMRLGTLVSRMAAAQ